MAKVCNMRQLHMFNSFLVYVINNLPFSGDHFTGLTMVIAEPNAFEAWLFWSENDISNGHRLISLTLAIHSTMPCLLPGGAARCYIRVPSLLPPHYLHSKLGRQAADCELRRAINIMFYSYQQHNTTIYNSFDMTTFHIPRQENRG